MIKAAKQVFAGFQLQRRIDRGEFCARLPAINDEPHVQHVPEADHLLKARLQEVDYLLAKEAYVAATDIVESSFRRNILVAPGVYEHTLLLQPFIEKFVDSETGMSGAVVAAEQIGYWFQDCPKNPYAAPLFALAVHQLGFAHRGTNWISEVEEDDLSVYQQCVMQAAKIMDESSGMHGDHWFWRYACLRLALSDYRGSKDHWQRFEQAVECQPYSAELWTVFAHQLLPRWHGEAGDLSRLCRRAWMQTRKMNDPTLYLDIFRMVTMFEQGDHELVLLDEVRELLILKGRNSSCDIERTLAVAALASQGDYEQAVIVMNSLKTLHLASWLTSDDPRWVIGMAEIHRPVNTQAA